MHVYVHEVILYERLSVMIHTTKIKTKSIQLMYDCLRINQNIRISQTNMRPTSLSGAAGSTRNLPCGRKGFEKTADLNAVVGVCGNKKKTPNTVYGIYIQLNK